MEGGSREIPRSRRTSLLEGVTAGALFGTAAIFIRYLSGFSVFSISFWRLVIASLALVAVLALTRSFRWRLFKGDFRRVLILGILLGTHFILFVSAVLDTTILNATVLVNTTPIWSLFVSSFMFKLRASRLAAFGIFVSFLGVFVISYGSASSAIGPSQLKGNLEATLAAVVEAFYLSYGRGARQKAPVLPLMLTIYVVSAFTVLAAGSAVSSSFALPHQAIMIVALIGLGILPTAMAHSFYFSSLSNLKSFETATMALLEPIGATLLGIFLFTEVPKPIFALGAALVLAGIIFVAVKE